MAWAYSDGMGGIEEDLTKGKKISSKVLEVRRKYAITSVPTFLEYYGYIFNFTNIMAGPAYEFVEYITSIHLDAFKDVKGRVKRPPVILRALGSLIFGLTCMAIHVKGSEVLPMHLVAEDEFIANHNAVYRYSIAWLALLLVRCKFYFVWKVRNQHGYEIPCSKFKYL